MRLRNEKIRLAPIKTRFFTDIIRVAHSKVKSYFSAVPALRSMGLKIAPCIFYSSILCFPVARPNGTCSRFPPRNARCAFPTRGKVMHKTRPLETAKSRQRQRFIKKNSVRPLETAKRWQQVAPRQTSFSYILRLPDIDINQRKVHLHIRQAKTGIFHGCRNLICVCI